MPKIRPSTPADGPRVVEIWRNAVDATHAFLTSVDRAALDIEVCGFLPSAPLYLAVDNADCAVGFMLLDGSHMEALFIDPAYHGQGVGRQLVEHGLGLSPAMTTDVNEQNPQALGFYQRLGFQQSGRSERDGQGRAYPLIHLRYVG